MEIDPFSTASVEVKAKPLTLKQQEGPKKLEFFSQAGKNRLLRISDENHLDEEVLFTGCFVGPSDSFVRDQVSDYVQNYLFKRSRRLSMERENFQTMYSRMTQKKEGNISGSRNRFKSYEVFENYIRKRNKEVDDIREAIEIERITKLLIDGEISTSPFGFEDIKNDPIFKVKRVMDKVRTLEKSKMNLRLYPFEIQTEQILDETFLPTTTNKEKSSILTLMYQNTKKVEDQLEEVFTSDANCNVEDDCKSGSSGFEELSPSPAPGGNEYEIPQSALSTGSYNITEACTEFEAEAERARSASIISDISDQELSICAEEFYSKEDISGDLEVSLDFSYESELVMFVKEQNDCCSMYEVASDVVLMYQRQKVAGSEFMEEFTSRYFGK